ncbi:primosomal protein DnaI [Bacillaceae bacterium JMAK1]|nr:primosomal protein DnaI [Bacillaceae bacterium JMAK1]
MEPIRDSLKKYMGETGWEKRLNKARESLFQDERIRSWLDQHRDELTDGAIEQGIADLYEYKNSTVGCNACDSLGACQNPMPGYQPELYTHLGQIHMRYQPCPSKIASEQEQKHKKLIQSMYVSDEFKKATFEKVELDDEDNTRGTAVIQAITFANEIEPKKDGKGLYLHGMFGVGKTYIAASIQNTLASRKISSLLVYAPEFFREMRQSVADGTVTEKLDAVKAVPVLILDDLGAETMSAWIRDDVLGVILQYRMTEKLPTVFTSNWDLDELEGHLAFSQKNGEERLKAKRLMERIRPMTSGVYVSGRNRRHE